jgi:hypothetical protein
MGYQMGNGRYARTNAVTLASAVTVTATGALAGSTVELGDLAVLRLNLTAASIGGTSPSITVTVETSADGSTGWTSVGAFTAVTANGTQRKVLAGLDRFVRLNATAVTGAGATASLTVSGEGA